MKFINEPTTEEVEYLLPQWAWLVPSTATPLAITAFGDWVFGNPDGSLSVLSLLEGTYETVASNAHEYNELNKSEEWCDEIFIASWYSIAIENGICPENGECLGWKVHPLLGGEFAVNNLEVFSTNVYQALMSQLHSEVQGANSPNN